VKRCLVVAPSHLTSNGWRSCSQVQLLFTLMDPDRAKEDREAAEAEAPDDDASRGGGIHW